jgi:hypothetical protein
MCPLAGATIGTSAGEVDRPMLRSATPAATLLTSRPPAMRTIDFATRFDDRAAREGLEDSMAGPARPLARLAAVPSISPIPFVPLAGRGAVRSGVPHRPHHPRPRRQQTLAETARRLVRSVRLHRDGPLQDDATLLFVPGSRWNSAFPRVAATGTQTGASQGT